LEGLAIEDVGIFYGYLVYFTAIWYIFHRLGMLYQENSGNPGAMASTYHFVYFPKHL
jgi:hypothetical protein